MYVILKMLLNKNLLFAYYRRNLQVLVGAWRLQPECIDLSLRFPLKLSLFWSLHYTYTSLTLGPLELIFNYYHYFELWDDFSIYEIMRCTWKTFFSCLYKFNSFVSKLCNNTICYFHFSLRVQISAALSLFPSKF